MPRAASMGAPRPQLVLLPRRSQPPPQVLLLLRAPLLLLLLVALVGAPNVTLNTTLNTTQNGTVTRWACLPRATAPLGSPCNSTSSSACLALNASCEWRLPPEPPSALPLCEDDAVWRFNSAVTCASFVIVMGADRCAEDWAVGPTADGTEQLAIVACERSCFGQSSGPQHCTLVAPTCVDTDGDAVEDSFDYCAEEAFALPGTFDNGTDADAAAAIDCTDGVCQPSDCCTEVRPEPEPEPEPYEPEPEPANITWTLGGGDLDSALGTGSCDAVCAAVRYDMVCVQSELDALSNESNATVLELQLLEHYAEVGLGCPSGLRVRCDNGGEPPGQPGPNTCERWGAPYVHNGLLASGACYSGTPFAPCSAVPVDINHRRLCPCAACNASDADDALCNETLVPPPPPVPEPEPEPALVLSDECVRASAVDPDSSSSRTGFGAVVVSGCSECEELLASAHSSGYQNRSSFCYCEILNVPSETAVSECRQRGGAFCSVSMYANLTAAQGGGSLHVDGSNYGCFASECINDNDLAFIAKPFDVENWPLVPAGWVWGSNWFAPGAEGWPFGYFQSFQMNSDQVLYGSGLEGRAFVRFEIQCGDVPEPEPEPEPPEPEPEPEPPEPEPAGPEPEPEPEPACVRLQNALTECLECIGTGLTEATCASWGINCGGWSDWRDDCAPEPEPEPEPEPIVYTLALRLALQFDRDVNTTEFGATVSNITGVPEDAVQIEVVQLMQRVTQSVVFGGSLAAFARPGARRHLTMGLVEHLGRHGITAVPEDITIDAVRAVSGGGRRQRRQLQQSTDVLVDYTITSSVRILPAFTGADFIAELVDAVNAAGSAIPHLQETSVIVQETEVVTQVTFHILVPEDPWLVQHVVGLKTELKAELLLPDSGEDAGGLVEAQEVASGDVTGGGSDTYLIAGIEVGETVLLVTAAVGGGVLLGLCVCMGAMINSLLCWRADGTTTGGDYHEQSWHDEITKLDQAASEEYEYGADGFPFEMFSNGEEAGPTMGDAAAAATAQLGLQDRPHSRGSSSGGTGHGGLAGSRPNSRGSVVATPPRTPDTNAFSPEHVRNRDRRRPERTPNDGAGRGAPAGQQQQQQQQVAAAAAAAGSSRSRRSKKRQEERPKTPEPILQLSDVWDPHSPIVDLSMPRDDPRRAPGDTGSLQAPPTLPSLDGHDFEGGLSVGGSGGGSGGSPEARVLDARQHWDAHRAARRRDRAEQERQRREAMAPHGVLESTLELSKRAVQSAFERRVGGRKRHDSVSPMRPQPLPLPPTAVDGRLGADRSRDGRSLEP